MSAIAVGALAAGFAAYPATSRLLGSNCEPVVAASDPALEQRADAAEKPSRGDRRSRCTLEGPLRAEVRDPKAFICPLAAGTDQTIDTMIEFGEPGVCVAVGTHVAARSSYRIAVCADRVTIGIYRGRPTTYPSTRKTGSATFSDFTVSTAT